jgi:hypothetical protein
VLKPSRTTVGELRRFGIGLGVGFAILGMILSLRGWPHGASLFGVSGLFLVIGILLPRVLTWLYPPWMAMTRAMGWLSTTLILSLIFYLVFTPIALVLRALGRDFLARRWDRDAPSYWVRREAGRPPASSYERQF